MKTESSPDAFDATIGVAATSDKRFADGRYVARRILGAGGQKIVYLVHDETLGRDCALALLKTELLEPEDLERLRREAQAMARVEQANIVAVYDAGEDAGRPFFVCQYVSGGDLRQELRTAGGPLALERAVAIAADVCAGLAAAHALGIVHRDIKPGNIWLSQDGSAKLGDFGLAFSIDRTRVTMSGTVMGTASYLAPEQALGQPVDARCDLYAVGCVLYEMLTGRPPFLGEDAVSVITQHIETPPVAPSWHNPQVPPALESLTLRLLAKSPDERPASAEEVREALIAVSESTPVTALPSAPERATSLDRLAGGVFVGREREVGELRAGLDEALSGRGGLLLLVGEPGIGKTRTANELCTYARLRGAQILVGRCHEGEGAPPYWPWMQAIRSYVQECNPDELRSDMGPGAADIAQAVSEVHERLPDLLPPLTLEPEQARFRLFDSITAFLKNAARRRPLVLLLDDLHWADKGSLLMLQFLVREIKDARLLVLGSYRDVELGRQHPLAQTLAELAREQMGMRVLLRGLGEAEVARYIEMTAGVAPSEALVAAVYRETEGTPFFLSEVVRLLVAEGRLREAGDTRSWTVTIPQSVREVVGRRLDHLSEDCNRVLTTAAVIGREFGLDALERLTQHDGDALLGLIEEAQAARVLDEVQSQRGVIGRYAFSHALIRETLCDELSTTRRVRLHQRVGEVLEALYGNDIDRHLSELAYHFGEAVAAGGDVVKAVDYLGRAGSASSAACAYEDAVSQFERALQLTELVPDDKALMFACQRSLALAQSATDIDAAIATSTRAISTARSIGDPHTLALAALAQSAIHSRANQFIGNDAERWELTRRLLEEALGLVPRENNDMCVWLLNALASLVAEYGDVERGLSASHEAVERARSIGRPQLIADALSTRHHVLTIGPPSALPERVLISRELATIPMEGIRLAAVQAQIEDCLAVGEMDRARDLTREYGAVCESYRSPSALSQLAQLRAMHALFEGRFDEAERLATELLTVGTPLERARVTARAAMVLGSVRRERGRLAELEPAIRSFAAQYEESIPAWTYSLALMYVESGRPDDARSMLEQFGKDEVRSTPRDANWMFGLGLLSEVAAALNDRTLASTLYELGLPFADQNAVATGSVLCLGACSRTLGLLATTMEHWDDAEAHFEHALAFNTRMGTPPWIAYTQYNYAAMLVKRGETGDGARARELRDDALEITRELGMTALQAKIESMRL